MSTSKKASSQTKKSATTKTSLRLKSSAKTASSGKSGKTASSPAPRKSSTRASSGKASEPESFLKLDQEIWPLERDVLFRPDRLKYVRKLLKSEGCVFCTAAKKVSLETLCVYQTEFSMIILNKFPYNTGHVMVIPRRHCGDLLQLSMEESVDLHHTLRTAMAALNEVYQPAGMNIGMNHGAAGGAGIPDHLHYHLIPRWVGDLNFFPLIAETKVVVESLEQTYERLVGYFKNIPETKNT